MPPLLTCVALAHVHVHVHVHARLHIAALPPLARQPPELDAVAVVVESGALRGSENKGQADREVQNAAESGGTGTDLDPGSVHGEICMENS
jgi:hypothetical protein